MSLDTYTGDGAQTDFTITYPYLSRDFIVVTLADAAQTLDTDYEFISATAIRFAVAPPAAADNVKIIRVTSATPLVDFANGAAITDTDLDTATQQALHVSEEANRNAVAVVGPAGPTGPTGADGADGADGQDGAAGGGGEWTVLAAKVAVTPGALSYSIPLTGVPASAERVRVRITNFRATQNDDNLRMGYSTGGGTNFAFRETDGYSYTINVDVASGTAIDQGSTALDAFWIATDISNTKISPSLDCIVHLGRSCPPALEGGGVIAESGGGGTPYAGLVRFCGILEYGGPVSAAHIYFNTNTIAQMDVAVWHDG